MAYLDAPEHEGQSSLFKWTKQNLHPIFISISKKKYANLLWECRWGIHRQLMKRHSFEIQFLCSCWIPLPDCLDSVGERLLSYECISHIGSEAGGELMYCVFKWDSLKQSWSELRCKSRWQEHFLLPFVLSVCVLKHIVKDSWRDV